MNNLIYAIQWEWLDKIIQTGYDWVMQLSVFVKVPLMVFVAIVAILGIISFIKKSIKLFIVIVVVIGIIMLVTGLI